MTDELQLRLFGGLHIALGGSHLTGFMSAKAPALLVYLAVTGRAQRRDDLAALLWGELPDADARNNLRQTLTNLRRILPGHLSATRDEVALDPDASRFLDVTAFEAQLHPSPDARTYEARATQLDQVCALYTGDFLAGFFVRDAPAFEEWMLAERARYRELALHALHTLTQLHLDAGAYDRVIGVATRLLAMDEWREESHYQLMLALARTGQRSAALAQYQRCRRLLQQEFGVAPSPETTTFYERIRAAMRSPRHNLPPAAVDLIGREADLAALSRRLVAPTCRLLTVVGPGGVGKTQLALAATRTLVDSFLDGVWVAPLAAAAGPGDLLSAIADGLGIAFSGSSSPEAQVLDYLRRKELLLLLDNFEHLIAPPALTLVCRMLSEAPGVKLLITSRARLNLAAEWVYDVPGLPYPTTDADAVETWPAVQLFVQRGQRIRSDFALTTEVAPAVAQICRLTAGLPLAVELAAAWMRTRSPAEIAAELGRGLDSLASTAYDTPHRHRSLAAVFEHSWSLLEPGMQTVLAQLACCRSGFDRSAAQAVADAVPPAIGATATPGAASSAHRGAVETALQTLVDQSLLRMDAAGRFDMHPLVQQFAAEKLAQCAPRLIEGARDRHARHYAALAGQHEHEFHGAQDRQALQWMLGEADNIRAAWDWGVRQADVELLEPFLESFLYFFDIQGRYRECVELTGQALHALEARRDHSAKPARRRGLGRLTALHAAFQFRLGEFALARQGAEDALTLLAPAHPHRDIGHARLYLGAAWYGLGDLSQAVRWFLAAAAAYEEVGHAWGIGAALDNAGYGEFLRGAPQAAEAYLKHSLAVAQQTGSRYLLTGVYDHLATLMASEQRFDEAMAYVTRCRKVLDELDRPYIVASLSLSLSQIAVQAGEYGAAESHLRRALTVAHATGNRLDLVKTQILLGRLQVARRELSTAAQTLWDAAVVGQEMRAESLLVDVVAAMADLAVALGEQPTASRLYRFVQDQATANPETASQAAERGRALGAAGAHPPLSLTAALSLGLDTTQP